MEYLKLSTAATMSIGPCLDSTGAEYTGLVIGDLTLTKNGTSAAMASAATLTATSNGFYDLVMTTGNTDTLGRLLVRCNKSTYQIPPREFMVLPASVFDAIVTNAAGGANGLLLSLASNQVDVGKWLGTAVSTPTVAGVPNVNAKTWNDLTTVALPLVPTTAGRTLDVSAGGEAGVDWANVGSPTASLALTGTTIATTQKVDIETIKTQVVTAAAGVMFPTSIASPTNIASGTLTSVGSVTGSVGSVTGNVGGNVTGSVGSIATGGIVAASFAAGAIDATAIATDAIGSAEISAAAVAKIQAGLATPTNITAGTITTATTATNVTTVNGLAAGVITAASIAADAITDAKVASDVTIASVTGNVGGNVVGSVASVTAAVTVGTINANVVNASALATDAVTEIQSGLATAANLATVAGYLDTEMAAALAILVKVDTMLVLDGAVYQLTANALELAPTGSGGGSSGTVLQANPSIQRGTTELTPIYFTFPTASLADAAFTTQTKRIDGATAANITGTITYQYSYGGLYWYKIAYDSSDRPASAAAGVVQYVLSDGTSTVAIDLRVSDIASSGGDVTDEFVKRGLHELG